MDFSQYISRIEAHDGSLWSDDPCTVVEIENRLGWTHLARDAHESFAILDSLTAYAQRLEITDVVLLGMGGSSLAPLVYSTVLSKHCTRTLHVLDSTCPDTVAKVMRGLDFAHTLFIVSSKSGATIETDTLESIFFDIAKETCGDDASQHFIAITDPGSPLELRANQRGYRLVSSPPEVGGRFSALSVFGLVPCALIGLDVKQIIEAASAMERACSHDQDNPAVAFAHRFLIAYEMGTRIFLLDARTPSEHAIGLWIEQLVAESLGKEGKGIIPLTINDISRTDAYDADNLQTISLGTGIDDPYRVGALFVLWEWTVALLGVVLDVNPFDQPDVARAKAATMAALTCGESISETMSLDTLESRVSQENYVVLLAFGDFNSDELLTTCIALEKKYNIPVIFQIGPRYLHSTGQLFKGGIDRGLYVYLFDASDTNIFVPDGDYSLREIFDAQRIGDITAMQHCDRSVWQSNSIEELCNHLL